MKLTKENTTVSQAEESGNLYITHPEHKVLLRFYAALNEIQEVMV